MADLLQLLQKKGIETKGMDLFFQKKALNPSDILQKRGIRNGSTVFLNPKFVIMRQNSEELRQKKARGRLWRDATQEALELRLYTRMVEWLKSLGAKFDGSVERASTESVDLGGLKMRHDAKAGTNIIQIPR